jgi:hypothetical protein
MSIESGEVVVADRIRIPLAASVGFVATTPTYRQSTASHSGPLRVTVEKGRRLTSPRALTPSHLIVLSYGEHLGPAMKQAVRAMVDYLVQDKGMAPWCKSGARYSRVGGHAASRAMPG